MTKKNSVSVHEQWRHLCATFLIFSVFIALLGCSQGKEKEKGVPSRASGSCEIFDKLPGDIAKPVEINYGGKVKLIGITTDKIAQDKLKISYYWKIIDDPGAYNVAFVHITDKDNKSLFQNDHDFCKGHTLNELKGKFIKEPYIVNIPQSATGKEVYIKIGIYAPDLKSDQRLKIESSGGTPVDDSKTRAIVEKLGL